MICTILRRAHYARAAPPSKDMKDLVRLFAQIALLRRGPQDVPASPRLLLLTILGYVGVNCVVSSLLPPEPHWQQELLVDTVFTFGWYVALLQLLGRPERILQTTTAVFGLQAVLSPLLIGSEWLASRLPEDVTRQIPITCWLLLFVWLIAANSHIVKAALEWSTTSSVVLVILQILLSWLLLFALFPPVKA